MKYKKGDDVIVKARSGKRNFSAFILEDSDTDYYEVASWIHGRATEHASNLVKKKTLSNLWNEIKDKLE